MLRINDETPEVNPQDAPPSEMPPQQEQLADALEDDATTGAHAEEDAIEGEITAD